METPLLKDIIIIFGLSIVVLFLFHRIWVPAIVGFLVTGILVGPHGLGLIHAVHEVKGLAEVGVVLLLFIIGIEFSLKKFLQIKKLILIGGSIQVIATVLIITFIAMQFGVSFEKGIFIGFLISLSSTAIVFKIIQDKSEIDSPHGKIILGILIFQDIVFVPMILVTPFLAGLEQNIWESVLFLLAKGVGIILLVIVGTKWVIPKLLYHIVKTRSRELFMLSVFVICFAISWFTNMLGLSFALGGFLAGLIISETEYNHQVISNILPFRDIFTSFFFISIGMLLNIGFLVKEPAMILLLTLSALTIKAIISFAASQTLGFPLQINVLVGLAVCQVGEFSFVLFETGLEYKLFSTNDSIYHYILSVTILTMTITPFITKLAPSLSKLLLRLPLPRKVVHGWHSPSKEEEKAESLKDHLIIIGFGVNGRNLARAAKVAKIPYVIIDMNPETVKNERLKGEPIFFGDASYEAILEHVSCRNAKVVVVAISDPVATKRMIETIRRLNQKAHIIARTRFLHEMLPLYSLGADDVIPQEYETSVEIFARVMANYLIPKDEIERLIAEVRADGYEMLRSLSKEPISLSNLKLHLSDVEITALRVGQESFLVGQSLAQSELRKKYGVTALAIKRASTILSDPIRDTKLIAKDVLIVLGQPDKIAKLNILLKK